MQTEEQEVLPEQGRSAPLVVREAQVDSELLGTQEVLLRLTLQGR